MIVPTDVLDAVRGHAVKVDLQRPGFESLGCLVVGDDDRLLRYVRLTNRHPAPGNAWIEAPRQFEGRRNGLRVVPLHSHPDAPATPSQRDVETATRFRWPLFAIFSPLDGLRFYQPDGDGVSEVPPSSTDPDARPA